MFIQNGAGIHGILFLTGRLKLVGMLRNINPNSSLLLL